MTLKELAIEHDYYCNESNYYSNEPTSSFDTFKDFYNEYQDADVDMNLVFRWDLREYKDSGKYYMDIYIIQQRKGIYTPIHISSFGKSDISNFIKYIQPHIDKLKSIWKPFKF